MVRLRGSGRVPLEIELTTLRSCDAVRAFRASLRASCAAAILAASACLACSLAARCAPLTCDPGLRADLSIFCCRERAFRLTSTRLPTEHPERQANACGCRNSRKTEAVVPGFGGECFQRVGGGTMSVRRGFDLEWTPRAQRAFSGAMADARRTHHDRGSDLMGEVGAAVTTIGITERRRCKASRRMCTSCGTPTPVGPSCSRWTGRWCWSTWAITMSPVDTPSCPRQNGTPRSLSSEHLSRVGSSTPHPLFDEFDEDGPFMPQRHHRLGVLSVLRAHRPPSPTCSATACSMRWTGRTRWSLTFGVAPGPARRQGCSTSPCGCTTVGSPLTFAALPLWLDTSERTPMLTFPDSGGAPGRPT